MWLLWLCIILALRAVEKYGSLNNSHYQYKTQYFHSSGGDAFLEYKYQNSHMMLPGLLYSVIL